MATYEIATPNRNLIKLNCMSDTYIDVSTIVLLHYVPFSDTLEIAWAGGLQTTLNNGRLALQELQGYLFSDTFEGYSI